MTAFLGAAWTAVRGWFSGLSAQLAVAIAVAALAAGLAFAIYQAGRASAQTQALRVSAAENAALAARYRQQFLDAQDAVARERAAAEALIADNAKLKEQVNAVAKEYASPGVDRAVRGLRRDSTHDPVSHVPRSRKRTRVQSGAENAVDGN
jgi:hypothetical protein